MHTRERNRAILAFFIMLPVVAFLAAHYLPAREVRKQLQAIRARGLPASAVELDRWYKPVAASENRAILVLKAAKVYLEPAESLKNFVARGRGTTSPETEREIGKYLLENQPALELLHQSARLRQSRYPVDLSPGPMTLVPHLAQVKRLVQLLRVDAAQQSNQGQVAGSVRSLLTSFAVADSLRNEPLLISDLVRRAGVEITLDALEQVLNAHALSDADLIELARRISDAEGAGPACLFRALVGERAASLSTFRMSLQEIERLGGSSSEDITGPISSLTFQLYRATGMHKRDLSHYLETMERLANSAKGELPKAVEEFASVDSELTARGSQGVERFVPAVSRMLLYPVTGAALKEANFQARLRCAQVALAVERFREDHGNAPPERLEQLVPKYLLKIPTDPIEGQPLEYELRVNKTYTITSPATAAQRRFLTKKGGDPAFSVSR